MPTNDRLSYERIIGRISRIILILGLLGASVLWATKGIRIGVAFLIGCAVSYLSFWGWQQVAAALGPTPKKRSSFGFTIRVILLGALACVIIKFLGLDVAAAVTGLLVSAAAVILELIYELIYART
jgi:ATP synthase I chain